MGTYAGTEHRDYDGEVYFALHLHTRSLQTRVRVCAALSRRHVVSDGGGRSVVAGGPPQSAAARTRSVVTSPAAASQRALPHPQRRRRHVTDELRQQRGGRPRAELPQLKQRLRTAEPDQVERGVLAERRQRPATAGQPLLWRWTAPTESG